MSGDEYTGVLPLGNPSDYSDDERLKGAQLRVGSNGRAELAMNQQKPSIGHASLSGPAPTFASPVGLSGTSSVHAGPAAPRAKTPDELMDMAHQMLDNQSEQHKALLGAGASTGDRNDAGGKVPDWLAQEMSRNDDR